jgi:hypothetical protein
MDDAWKNSLWQQHGAAIEMLEKAVLACPDEIWSDPSRQPQFWYVAYHTLFFLDLYASESIAGFAPPAPFTLSELEPDSVPPDPPYTQAELQGYLDYSRAKCWAVIDALTDESAHRRCGIEWHDISEVELVLYSLRHVQHHSGQLYLMLRQAIDSTPGWVKRTEWHISQRSPTDLGVSAASLLEEERRQRERDLG